MLDPRFVFLAAAIDLAGTAAYARDTLLGHTKPNRVSWLLWTVAPLIGFFAQISQGVGLIAVLTFVIAFGPFLVLAASFINKQSYWKITTFDLACGGISVLALILWLATGQGVIAILLSMVADFTAGIPTVVKSYTNPETESSGAYFAGIFSAGITFFTIRNWNVATYAFPVYLFVMCAILFMLVKFPNFRFNKKVSSV
jgi:hypothetical protein